MVQNTLLLNNYGNTDNKPHLTDKPYLSYIKPTDAKNSISQNLPSEMIEAYSRLLLRGFFYARNSLVYCAIMTDCTGECLASALRSPRSLISGKANPVRSVTFQFALKMTASNLIKETV